MNRARRVGCGSAGGGASKTPALSSSSAAAAAAVTATRWATAVAPRAATAGAAVRRGATAEEDGRKAPKRERCGEGVAPRSRRGEEPERCGDDDTLGDPARADADAAEGDEVRSPPLHEVAADDADAKAAEIDLERDADRLGDEDVPRALLLVPPALLDLLVLVAVAMLLPLLLLLLTLGLVVLLVLLTVLRANEGVGDADDTRPRREAAAVGDIIAADRAKGGDGAAGVATGDARIRRSECRAGVDGGSARKRPAAGAAGSAAGAAGLRAHVRRAHWHVEQAPEVSLALP